MPVRDSNHLKEVVEIWSKGLAGLTVPKGIAAGFTSFILWVSPPPFTSWLISGIILLILLDFITGVRLALKKGKFITSKLYGRIVDKGIAFGTLILLSLYMHKLSATFGQVVINDIHFYMLGGLVDAYLIVVVGSLLTSLFENMEALGLPFARYVSRKLKIATHQYADKSFGVSDSDG